MEIDINAAVLDEELALLNSINANFISLSNAMNNVDLSGVQLQSAPVFNQAKVAVNDIINGGADEVSMAELQNTISTVRNILIENNDEMLSLFSETADEYAYVERDSVELKNYLANNFNTFKELENGGYYIKAYNGDEYYFSEDCNVEDVHLIGYYPGMGGFERNPDALRNLLKNGGVPSGTVVAISAHSKDDWFDSMDQNLFDKFDIIANNCGIDVTSVQTIGFSYGGDMPLRRMNDYLEAHPEIKNASVISVDGGCMQNVYGGSYPCEILKERNVPVYILSPVTATENYNRNYTTSTELFKDGFNVTFLLENTAGTAGSGVNCHDGVNDFLFTDGLYNYLSGESESMLNIDNYTANRFNFDETGQLFMYKDDNLFAVQEQEPIIVPLEQPSNTPEQEPIVVPEEQPSQTPQQQPIVVPEEQPSQIPEQQPIVVPQEQPSQAPQQQPTVVPQEQPSQAPQQQPTVVPQEQPSQTPQQQPIVAPQEQPSQTPQQQPIVVPEEQPDQTTDEELIIVPDKQPENVSPVTKPNNNNSDASSTVKNNDGVDAKKIIIPGIIGTGLALASAKIGKFIKKNKKNNDV